MFDILTMIIPRLMDYLKFQFSSRLRVCQKSPRRFNVVINEDIFQHDVNSSSNMLPWADFTSGGNFDDF